MTDAELDQVYTHLCHTLTAQGEAQAPLYLARLALLALHQLGDATAALALVDAAALEGEAAPGPQAAASARPSP